MQIEENYKWATHTPLIKGVLELYKPDWVLEVGVGLYSTPLFKDLNYIGIENDSNWIEKIRKTFPDMRFIHHNVSPLTNDTHYTKVSIETRIKVFEFYKKVELPKKGLGLLFVDNFSGIRKLAINSFSDKVDIVIFHDTQPRSRNIVYNYSDVNENGFNKYTLTSSGPWTTILIRKEIDKGFSNLRKDTNPFIREFTNKWKDAEKTNLIYEW